MMKLVKWGVLVLVVLFVLSFAKNLVVQSILVGSISNAAHVPVSIGSTDLSLTRASLDVRNFRLGNPSGYPERTLADVSRIYFDIEPGALSKGLAHFKEVDLNVKEITVIKNSKGQMNVDALKPSKKAEKDKPAKSGAKAPKLKIDRLKLSIGRVVFKDYSQGSKPAEQVFEINIKDRVYNNIQDPSAVVSLVMFEALTRTTLSRLANLDMSMFKDGASGALSDGLGLVGDGVDSAETAAKNLLGLFQ